MSVLTCTGQKKDEFTVSLMAMLTFTGPCPLVLCGPSGSGKSTVMKKVLLAVHS